MAGWNDLRGDWQGLSDPAQSPRYRAIAGLLAQYLPGTCSVLDVGCGEAVLARFLPSTCAYTGIEPSAKALQGAGRPIIHSTAEDFSPAGRTWDAIIFNEMLYYTREPVALMNKYVHLLSPKGLYVISIYQRQVRWRDRIRQILGRGRNANAICTRLVDEMMKSDDWNLLQTLSIPIPGTREAWRLWAATRRLPRGALD
jgi:SAM-dependent methyltransferase